MKHTTDPNLRSFVDVPSDNHFPIQNLPYGVFMRKSQQDFPRIGVAIGALVLDLRVLEDANLFDQTEIQGTNVFSSYNLNEFMSLGKSAWISARERISNLLEDKPGPLRDDDELRISALIPIEDVIMLMPFDVPNYTDFYSSRYHAQNVGTMFRGPDNALMENWLHLPVAYHGRASSVIISGVDIHRPLGQSKPQNADKPLFGPSKLLDFEFEMGIVIGTGNELGEPISIDNAKDHIFGFVILNDWSARDIQGWEYQPLGPFNAKNFATSISPWVVPFEALKPFVIPAENQDPPVLDYLAEKDRYMYDVILETYLKPENSDQHKIMSSNMKYLYWSINQMIVHHTITGCNMQTGDLLGTGTISGPEKFQRACMLELTWRGSEPIDLPSGESRKFLEDGDTVVMTAFCQAESYKIGFGEVFAKIMPAHDY
jgi:fumarylacetoacetase